MWYNNCILFFPFHTEAFHLRDTCYNVGNIILNKSMSGELMSGAKLVPTSNTLVLPLPPLTMLDLICQERHGPPKIAYALA